MKSGQRRRRVAGWGTAAMVVAGLLFISSRVACREGASFDGERALERVRKQCAFGPRNPGSGGHAACLKYLETELAKTGAAVRRQSFSYTPPGGKRLEMVNLIASFEPASSRRVLLAAHWDTRPWADMDPDSTRHNQPIIGANDGASGVAVLLELAGMLGREKPAWYGVDIVFFDGEDMGTQSNPEGFFRGSREYARTLSRATPEHALLLDMVGDRDLMFKVEAFSAQYAPATVEWVWKAGREVAPAYFSEQIGYAIEDDHMPLIAAHLPCADLIDFDYPWWHTLEDTPDKVSAASLQVVGDVLVHLLYPR